MAEEKELWHNTGRGQVWIWMTNVMDKQELRPIGGGEKFMISPSDRRNNQDMAMSGDFFTDGTFAPVKLVDSAKDFEELASNPGVMSDSDVAELFELTAPQLKKRLAEIDNKKILRRIQEVANADSTKATLAQVRAIDARVEELTPEIDPDRQLPDHTDGQELTKIYLS